MKILKKNKNENYTIIIGCGRLGSNIANTLSNEGENVLIIDDNRESFKRLDSSYGGLAIIGDGTDFDVLREAQITKATTVIVVTNDDNINIMIAQIAKGLYKIEKVIVRLYDEKRQSIYQEYGIDTICPAALSVKEIDKVLS